MLKPPSITDTVERESFASAAALVSEISAKAICQALDESKPDLTFGDVLRYINAIDDILTVLRCPKQVKPDEQ